MENAGIANKSLIDLENVNVVLGNTTILDNVTFSVNEGEFWAILGRNGSGKTTLLRLLLGDQWVDPGSQGRRLYCFDETPEESCIGNRERIGYVSLELQQRYRRMQFSRTAERVIKTGFFDALKLSSTLTEDMDTAYRQVVDLLEIDDLVQKNLSEMSEGEQRKIMIARALIAQPRLLLLDEIFDGLDAPSRRSMMALVSRMAKTGKTIVMTTHRPEEILPEVSHVAIVANSRIDRQGLRQEVLEGYFNQSNATQLDHSKESSIVQIQSDATGITVKKADVFIGRHHILHDINLEINPGENWALVGTNGSGKSTFMGLLYGEHYPSLGGSITRFNLPNNLHLRELRHHFGIVGSALQSAYESNLTALELAVSGYFSSTGLYDEATAEQKERARMLLDEFGIADRMNQAVHTLSNGQQRRVLLARAIIHEPRMLLMDEPFNGLDHEARLHLQSLLGKLVSQGVQLVLATHHDEDLMPCIDHVAIFRSGHIIQSGTREEVLPKGIASIPFAT